MNCYHQTQYSGTFPNHSQQAHISTHQSQNEFIYHHPQSSNHQYLLTEQSFQLNHSKKNQQFKNNLSLNELIQYQIDNNEFKDTMNFGEKQNNSFMNNSDDLYLNEQISELKNKEEGQVKTLTSQEVIILNRDEIRVEILPKQKILQSFEITNGSSTNLQISIDCIFPLKKSLNKFKLNPWSTEPIYIQLTNSNGEQFGDVFQTIVIQYNEVNSPKQINKIYMPISIHVITPRLKLCFDGSSEVVSVPVGHANEQIAKITIKQNCLSEYPIQVSLNKMNFNGNFQRSINRKFDNQPATKKNHFVVKTYGGIKVFPDNLYLIGNQSSRIIIKRDSNAEKGVLQIKSSGTVFVFVVAFN